MKSFLAALFLSRILYAQELPAPPQDPQVQELESRLQALLNMAPAPASIGIHVVEIASGRTVFASDPGRLLLPASNLKIVTSAAALARLSGEFRFTTRVVQTASGDVVLLGSGDPTFSGRTFPYQKNARNQPPLIVIDDLADQIAARGVTRIAGDIVGDDRLYLWDPYPPSWTIDDTTTDYGAPVSALSLNDNSIAITVVPGANPGDPVLLIATPSLELLTIVNRAVTGPRGSAPSLRFERIPNSDEWQVSGSLPAGRGTTAHVIPVHDPALFAATALYEALIRRGISIQGRPRAAHRLSGEEFTPPPGRELAARTSPSLQQILQVMNKLSDNLYAELVLRAVARQMRGEGSLAAGIAEVSNYLVSIGADKSDFRIEDGSGLSRNALVTPRLLTRVLTHMAASRDSDTWISLLPVGGEDGTLEKRLCCVSGNQGVRAKTGTLARAQSLSGYADSATFGRLAFSILANDFAAQSGDVREWIDKLAKELLR